METTCCILFLFVVPLTCLSCHAKCTDDISVFTSEDSDSSSSSGSDTDAKAPQQNSGPKEKILPVDGLDKEKGKFCFIGVSICGISTKPILSSAY